MADSDSRGRSGYAPPAALCPDCLTGEHRRSECPAHLPCTYWADSRHCFNATGTRFKMCRCEVRVYPVGEHP